MNKSKNNLLSSGLWVVSLIIQGIAVFLYSWHLLTRDFPVDILSLALLLMVYAAIVIPTVNVVRGKVKSENSVIAIAVLNAASTVIAIGFLIFVAGLYDALHYDY